MTALVVNCMHVLLVYIICFSFTELGSLGLLATSWSIVTASNCAMENQSCYHRSLRKVTLNLLHQDKKEMTNQHH